MREAGSHESAPVHSVGRQWEMMRQQNAFLVFVLRTAALAASLCLWRPGLPVYAEWSVIGEQKISYTTDAFQFSSARRLRFTEDPSQPTVVSTEKRQERHLGTGARSHSVREQVAWEK